MGYIREPKGVDFIIESKPLTEKERAEISEYIRNYKTKQKAKPKRRTTAIRRKTSL